MTAVAAATPVFGATTGWNPTTPGTYSYTDTANWVGNVINDTFDASLSLADDTVTGSQVLTFNADYATSGILNFAYTDANTASVPYNFTLRADGVANRTLTLAGGGLTFTPVRTTRLLTIGSATENEKLHLNLGDAARTFSITASGNDTADPGSGVTINNIISGGTITKEGSGWLRIAGAESNTFTGLTVNAGVVRLQKTGGLDAVAGNVTVTGGTLLWGASNQIANSASIVITGGLVDYGTIRNSTSTGNTNFGETVTNLTISGGSFLTGSRTNGSASTGTSGVTGTMYVSGGSVTIRNQSTFTVNRLDIVSATTVNVSGASGSGTPRTTLVTGAGGVHINQIETGVMTPLNIGAWGRWTLSGDVTFNGHAANTNTALIAASAISGGDTLRTLDLSGGMRTFTINDGGAEVDLAVDADLTISNGSLTKSGTGTLQINGNGPFTGGLTVAAGRLIVNGAIASAASVNAGTLGGEGTIGGGITATSGNINPGAAASGSLGTLTAAAVTIGDGGTLTLDLGAATASDVLAVTGNLDLTSLLDTLTINGAGDGSAYTLATYGGSLTGVFNSISLPSGYELNYGTGSNSSITLVQAPEPTSLAWAGLAGLGLLARRRRNISKRL